MRSNAWRYSSVLAAFFMAWLAAGGAPAAEEQWTALFNGTSLEGWHLRTPNGPNGWKIVGGTYVNTPPSTDIQTDREFYNFDLHVEFNVTPGGNSGVYMRDKYEVQILDSYGKPAAVDGCGALYRKVAPAVNASKPAGEWQTFDIHFVGRRLTVIHNGQKVLDDVDVGPMGTGQASQRADGPGPLRLQGDHTGVSFRNLRLRPLPGSPSTPEGHVAAF
jgi:3-keto-disaccharide hydrolase